jgi:undecaprenyl diphosphate synthase
MSEPSPLPIPAASLPAHIAIIMDGNGRWAQERGLSRSEGHKAGVRAAKAIVTECRTLGIRHLTLYTFSQENWGRPKDEVSLLFQLLVSSPPWSATASACAYSAISTACRFQRARPCAMP